MKSLRPIRVAKEDGEKESQPLSPMARVFHEPNSNVYIVVIMGFKTPINSDVVKVNLAQTFLKHPRFSSLQVMDEENGGEMRWVRTEVNIDNHVIVPKLDPNMDCPDKFVEDYTSNLSKTTISRSMPMWDIHILKVKTSEAESTSILRVHHSIGDGTSLMSLLLSCTRKVSNPTELPTLPTLKKRNPNDSAGFWHLLLKLWMLVLLCWNTVVDVVIFLATILFLKDTKTRLKGASPVGSTARRFVHRTISLDDVKLVKNAMGSTVNDVMMAITQAGLSCYLNRKYGDDHQKDDEGAKGKNNLPKNIRLRATFCMNIRPSAGIPAFDDMTRKDSEARWGNHIGYVLFPFTIALKENPLDYVRDAKITGDRKKATLESKFTYFMARFFLNFCGTKMGNFPTQTTLWFSNVAGPQEEISYFGHPVTFIAPTLYGQPNALMIHVASYENKMKIILSADENIIPDPHQLCDDLQNSLSLIKDAVIKSKRAAEL
ncbi:hypothetical protein P3X46_028188 [Hevea brasiliensis]|uniref:Diacylglycerol O-acyltransferase n=1 Tax=Hevea brasiliensis TaxID=3981 RepID=A0ABQ9KN71_HEVBR|nr:wax ester synthase/diacylglycerol acyltransferase 5 [Hevea brasiliensis]KAJ9145856.1 hypothetical protein P3X46_028188 [Hevea brasiliensis]